MTDDLIPIIPIADPGTTTSPVNRLEIRVVGMSRSGNHAIIDWILSQAVGGRCFLNCAEPKTNPFRTNRPLRPGRDGFSTNIPGLDLAAEIAGRHLPKDLLVHSYEDTFLGPFARADVEAQHDRWLGTSQRRVDVLILRDPFNLFASRLVSGLGGVSPDVATRIWSQHAREFLGRQRNLRHERIMISFNRWATDPSYRRALALSLGLRFDDSAAYRVAPCAGGSSFEGTRYDGRATQMPVLERWREVSDRPDYRRLFTPPLLELAAEVFGTVVTDRQAQAA